MTLTKKNILIFFVFFQLIFLSMRGYSQKELNEESINLSHLHYDLFCENMFAGQLFENNSSSEEKEAAKENSWDIPFVFGQIGFGSIAGVLVGFLTSAGLGFYERSANLHEEGAEEFAFIFGWLSGYAVGSTGGVYFFGRSIKSHGSFIATIAGGSLGTLIGYEIARKTEWGWGFFILPPVCATIAFNMSL